MRHRWARVLVLTARTMIAVIGGDERELAAAQCPHSFKRARGQRTPSSGGACDMKMAYSYEQLGSAVAVTRAVHGAEYACDSARVRNDANVAATGLAFVAVVELRQMKGVRPGEDLHDRRDSGKPSQPVREPTSTLDLLPQADWSRTGSHFAPKIQVMCALAKVTYANGSVWEVTPNPAARTAERGTELAALGGIKEPDLESSDERE